MKTLNQHISNFKKHLSTSGRGVSTVNSYGTDLKFFASYLDKKKLSYLKLELSHLEAYTDELQNKNNVKANSIRRKIISLRQFYKFLDASHLITENPFTRSLIPERREKLPNLLSSKNVKQLFEKSRLHPNLIKRYRDQALLALLAFEGIKVTELIALTWADYLQSSGGGTLRVDGDKKRIIQLDAKSASFLEKYHHSLQREKNSSYQPRKSKSMFIAFKGRELETKLNSITRHGLKFLLYELGELAGIKKLNSELLRHYAINYLLEKYEQMPLVQQHLGLKKPGNILKHLAKKKLTPQKDQES